VHNLRIARRYAKALVLAAVEADTVAEVREAAASLLGAFEGAEELRAYVADSLIPPATKRAVFDQLFADQYHPLFVSFLLLMVDRRRERDLQPTVEEALRQLDERSGVEKAVVRSAVPLTEAQSQALAAALSRMRGTTVELVTHVDPSLQAGFVAQLADTVVDASLTGQLARVRERLIEG